MQFYLAPMEGLTGYVYRNAYHKYFPAADRYFTPFITNKKKSMPERVTFFTFSILKFLPYVSFWNQCIIQVHFKVKTFSAFFSIFPTILVYFVFSVLLGV